MTLTLPQWSLTSSVRKSRSAAGHPRCDGPPAMEPDLIGQEKNLGSRLSGGINKPAMEPDLIGQEKVRSSGSSKRALTPAMEPDLIGQEKDLPPWIHGELEGRPQWSLTSSVRKRAR